MPYIYKITNLINGKIYIGKTSLSSVQKRMKEHINDSYKHRQEKRPLYDAFNKYGIENFKIEAIEQVENDNKASEREIYWINKLRTYIGFKDCMGYNATLGGDSRRLYDYKQLSKAYLKLGTIKAVCRKYNCDDLTVRNACREYGINIKIAPNKKKIKRINKTGEIKIYNSVTDAAKDFPDKSIESARKNISRGLNHNQNAYGYTWEFI